MDFSTLKQYMDKLVNEYNAPGVDCIVYQEHKKVFRYFTGMSDIENNKPMCGNELYLIFSMTKMITCVCALQLIEQGKISFDDPIYKYLPEFEQMKVSVEENNPNDANEIATGKTFGTVGQNKETCFARNHITVKDLFTMGAGLDYNLSSDAIKNALSNGKTSTRDLVKAISKTVLGFEPGTSFRYSLCHDVLGALIEVVSGMKLGQYMKENVFIPLEMKDTFFGVPEDEERLSRMAARYMYDENRKPQRMSLECPYNLSKEYESGGAGLVSSTEDYAIFLDALANGGEGKNGNRVLKPSTVKLMRTNHMTEEQMIVFAPLRKGYGYGLGVRTHIDKEKSGSLSPIGEFGWDGAAGAFSLVDSKNNISLTFFQHIHGWEPKIQTEMRNALYVCLNKKY